MLYKWIQCVSSLSTGFLLSQIAIKRINTESEFICLDKAAVALEAPAPAPATMAIIVALTGGHIQMNSSKQGTTKCIHHMTFPVIYTKHYEAELTHSKRN